MKLHQPTAGIFVPDGLPLDQAAARISHLGVGAHQDDLEFMAFHGIVTCHASETQWFGGVTCTNGSGSPRTGAYAGLTDAQMMSVRRAEQNAAAAIGRFGLMIQLDHPSDAIKKPGDATLKDDLKEILGQMRPQRVYTHNLADKHDTHIAVLTAALQAMRELPGERRPRQLVGCEVWRDLDWMLDEDKVRMDVSGHDGLMAALSGAFQSQTVGGKRYDLAIPGRRAANATFFDPHAADQASQVILGMDLTPLLHDEWLDPIEFVNGLIERFRAAVNSNLKKQLGRA